MTAMTPETYGKGSTKMQCEPVQIPDWDGFGCQSPTKSVHVNIIYTMISIFVLSTVLYNTCRHNGKCLEDLSI